MEARYAFRKSQLLDECQVAPEIFEQVLPRLETFMKPFVRIFQGQAAEQHAKTYVYGLLSQVERKNIESIAYSFGPARCHCTLHGGDAGTMPVARGVAEQIRRAWDKARGVGVTIRRIPNTVGSPWGWHCRGCWRLASR